MSTDSSTTGTLPQLMDMSSARCRHPRAHQAVQPKDSDEGFLSRTIPKRPLPGSILDTAIPPSDDSIDERCSLMALKIKTWFEVL